MERCIERETEMSAGPRPGVEATPDGIAEMFGHFVVRALGEDRAVTLTRYDLQAEVARTPDLRASYAVGADAVDTWALGPPPPAPARSTPSATSASWRTTSPGWCSTSSPCRRPTSTPRRRLRALIDALGWTHREQHDRAGRAHPVATGGLRRHPRGARARTSGCAPSLCTEWRVVDVAAHLAWAPVAGRGGRRRRDGPPRLLDEPDDRPVRRRVVGPGPGGDPRPAAGQRAHRGPPDRHATRRGPRRRGRARPRRTPPAWSPRAGAAGVAGAPGRLRARHALADERGRRRQRAAPRGGRTARGHRRRWSYGDGPEVRGSAEALLLLLYGRRPGAGELTGPGAAGARAACTGLTPWNRSRLLAESPLERGVRHLSRGVCTPLQVTDNPTKRRAQRAEPRLSSSLHDPTREDDRTLEVGPRDADADPSRLHADLLLRRFSRMR